MPFPIILATKRLAAIRVSATPWTGMTFFMFSVFSIRSYSNDVENLEYTYFKSHGRPTVFGHMLQVIRFTFG